MTLNTRDIELKNYKKGTVLLTEKPFVFILKGKLNSERCDFCFSRTELLKCSGCSYARYCDRDCQRKGWFYHKKECSCIKRVSPKVVPDAARMLARMIIRLENGGAHERSFYTKTKFRIFKDLMSHYNEIKEDKTRMEHFLSLQAVLQEYMGPNFLPNTAELLGIYGRMITNTFNILDDEMQSIGTGLYLAASIIDHSCSPNAVAIFEGTTIHIRTLKDLKCITWSDIYISYIDILDLSTKRQKELESMYYFLCQCPKCLDVKELRDMTSVICQFRDCGKVIPGGILDEELICEGCNQKITSETVKKIQDVVQFTEKQLENMKDTAYLDVCRMCLNKQKGLLHNWNIYYVKILDMAVESCIALENWESALEYGLEVKDKLRQYYGDCHPIHGIFLMKLGKIALFLEKLEANHLLCEAAEILKITHGEKHALVKYELNSLLQQSRLT